MAETIDELLVKLGLETDAKGFKEANNQFSNLRSTALTVGAAIGTAFVGAGVAAVKMSSDIAKSADDLGKWSKAAGVSAQFADKLSFAMAKFGGSSADARALIDRVNDIREAARFGELSDRAFTVAGFNPQAIQQQNMGTEETLDFLSREISKISDQDQRRRVLDALGISGPYAQNLLSDRGGYLAEMDRAEALGVITDALIQNAAAYNDAVTENEKVLRSMREEIADRLLPIMGDWVKAMTGWVQENKAGVLEAVDIISGDGTPLEKAQRLVTNKEVQKTTGSAASAYFRWIDTATGWHPANMLMHRLFGDNGSSAGNVNTTRGPLSNDAIFDALIQQESGGRHYGDGSMLLRSPKGARGITQVMPATGRDPGYGVRPLANDSREEYLRFGRDYLAAMMKEFDGDTQKALAAYNAGPGAVKNAVSSHGANWLSAMPDETQAYVPSILDRAQQAGTVPAYVAATTASPPDIAAGTAPKRSGTTNYYSIDARGATDPGAVEAAARKVFRAELSNAVQVSRDGIPNNVE